MDEGVREGVVVVGEIAIVDIRTDLVELIKFTEWFGIPITGEGVQNKLLRG